MIPRKYLEDYQIVERVDDKGRVRKEAVYIAGDYVFAPPVSRKERWTIVGLCALAALTFIAALVPATMVARTTYVMVPFILTPVPLYLMSTIAIALVRAGEKMIRSDAERITQRLSPYTLLAAVLPAASLIALLVACLRSLESFQAGDAVFCVMAAACTGSSAVIFKKSRKVKAVKR